ncbi:MAG: hypothetical protein AAF960_22805 [Bacteroidota bacterium]
MRKRIFDGLLVICYLLFVIRAINDVGYQSMLVGRRADSDFKSGDHSRQAKKENNLIGQM